MTESSNNSDLPCFDCTPYLRLVVDKEGRWFQNGVEIIHPLVLKQFLEALEKKPEGGYRIRIGREVCSVEVEDTPFIVSRILQIDEKIRLELNDGSQEILDPETLWINQQNVPYVLVKDGQFPARLSRPAYYELARTLDFDEIQNTFVLQLNGKTWPVRSENKTPLN
ncbi:MAG: hypothetical protein V1897_10185 [Pseudomonadota bacterium]